MTSMLSFIMSRSPPSLGKVYALESDGRLTKQAVAQVTAGKVVCRHVPDAEALVRILAVVTERADTAICPAGPPKLSAAIRVQVRTAAEKGTP